MKLTWTKTAWEDYLHWQSVDKKKIKRINELIKAIFRDPFN
ncbi:MAG TPA: type II toxin-antitoxin system YoeB family toxin, partial [Pelobium sp.]|nr:type II toxin-antitoxin system YoeB family toxin [Pelobium sp.]